MSDISTAPRKFALVAEVKAGDTLRAGGGFTCIRSGALLEVKRDNDGELFVPCQCRGHYLSGQISNDGREYIGLYHVGRGI